MQKKYIGSDDHNNPFKSLDELCIIIDEAEEITKAQFLAICKVTHKLARNMKQYPNDYTYHRNREIYFYTHSAMQYFYR